MKKTIFLGLILGFALPFSTFAAFDMNLKYGSSGPAVTELQEFLQEQGVYNGPVTGKFYSLTLAGVKAFQMQEGVSPVSGFWGPLSRAKASAKLNIQASNDDEQAQTGSVVTPVVSESQSKIDDLAKKVQDLTTQVQKQTQGKQNTDPISNPVTPKPEVKVFNFSNENFRVLFTAQGVEILAPGNRANFTLKINDDKTYTFDGDYSVSDLPSETVINYTVTAKNEGGESSITGIGKTLPAVYCMDNLTCINKLSSKSITVKSVSFRMTAGVDINSVLSGLFKITNPDGTTVLHDPIFTMNRGESKEYSFTLTYPVTVEPGQQSVILNVYRPSRDYLLEFKSAVYQVEGESLDRTYSR